MPEYFSHDYGARNDIKLKKLFIKHGHEGKGIYWDLIEMLYENSGYISQSDIPALAYDLRTTEDKINSLIDDFDLFERTSDGKFYSGGVLKRLELRETISNERSKAAKKRWENHPNMQMHSKSNANGMQMHSNCTENECKSNAIKENKRKENKKKENIKGSIARDFLESQAAEFGITADEVEQRIKERRGQ